MYYIKQIGTAIFAISMGFLLLLTVGITITIASAATAAEVGESFSMRAYCKSNKANDGPHPDWLALKEAIASVDPALYTTIMTHQKTSCVDLAYYAENFFPAVVLGLHEEFTNKDGECFRLVSVRELSSGTKFWSWDHCNAN